MIYEYRNLVTGTTELHFKTVRERDNVPPYLKRITVPSRVGICGLACAPSQSSEIMQGFKKAEEKIGINEIRRQSGFSAKEIKEIWTEGYHPEERKGFSEQQKRENEKEHTQPA